MVLDENDGYKVGGTIVFKYVFDITFSDNIVNAGDGGIAGDTSTNRTCVLNFEMKGNSFVSGFFATGGYTANGAWTMQRTSYHKEALFSTYLTRVVDDTTGTVLYTSLDVSENTFSGMTGQICPVTNHFNYTAPAGTVSQSFGDRLVWRDNIIPAGCSLVATYLQNNGSQTNSWRTVDTASYTDYTPPEE